MATNFKNHTNINAKFFDGAKGESILMWSSDQEIRVEINNEVIFEDENTSTAQGWACCLIAEVVSPMTTSFEIEQQAFDEPIDSIPF